MVGLESGELRNYNADTSRVLLYASGSDNRDFDTWALKLNPTHVQILLQAGRYKHSSEDRLW